MVVIIYQTNCSNMQDLIIKPLTLLINQTLSTVIFPNELKISKVRPLFRNGDTSNINNYRSSVLLMCGGGVSSYLLLPLVARCLETIDVCIWRMFVFMSVVVIVWGSVGMLVV